MRWMVLALLLAGCAGGGGGGGGPAPQSLTERSTEAACREQANQTYVVQNRDQIYRIRDNYAPQSSIGLTENPTRGLSDSFGQQRMIANCIRNTGTGSAASPVVSGPSAAPSSGSLSR